jgi:hypothetical protein
MRIVKKLAIPSLLFSSAAIASDTRVMTLQNLAGVEDGSDVFLYPSLASRYNLALIELGTSSNSYAYAAAMAPVSATVHFGAAVNRHTWQSSYNNSDSSLFMQNRFMYHMTTEATSGADDSLLVKGDRSVDLFGAMSLSSERSVGLRLSTAKERLKTSTTTPSASTEQSANTMQLALGYSVHGATHLDFAFTMDAGDKYKYEKVTAGSKSGVELASSMKRLDGRWIANPDDSGYFANASFIQRSGKAKITTSGSQKDGSFSDQIILAGGGYAYAKKDTATKLFAGANIYKTTSKGPSSSGTGATATSSLLTSTEQVKVNAQWIDAALSGESKFYENIGAMFGTNYTVFGSYKEDNAITKTKEEAEITSPSDANLWSLGLFWATDKSRIDATMSKTFLHNGPHFVAGNTTSPLFGRIAATFNF